VVARSQTRVSEPIIRCVRISVFLFRYNMSVGFSPRFSRTRPQCDRLRRDFIRTTKIFRPSQDDTGDLPPVKERQP